MAKRKSAKSGKKPSLIAGLFRGLAALWRFVAKILGSAIRFIFRQAKELDEAHQRDGFAFFLVVLAILAASGSWFHLNNIVGRGLTAFLLGTFGRLAFLAPVIFIYFAVRLFSAPQEGRATGRITIGTLLLLVSLTGLAHIFNGSVGDTGKSAIQGGGGWIGYGVATPLVALVTSILAIPILFIILFFSLLIITATPVSNVFGKIAALFRGTRALTGKARKTAVEDDFEISDTPPFESPLVQEFHDDEEEPEEEIEEEYESDETVALKREPTFVTKTTQSQPAHQMILTADTPYILPSMDLLRAGPATKAKSKANEITLNILT